MITLDKNRNPKKSHHAIFKQISQHTHTRVGRVIGIIVSLRPYSTFATVTLAPHSYTVLNIQYTGPELQHPSSSAQLLIKLWVWYFSEFTFWKLFLIIKCGRENRNLPNIQFFRRNALYINGSLERLEKVPPLDISSYGFKLYSFENIP